MKDIKKAVLAYSGGLDTSIIISWLKENYGCEVVAFVADVGQGDDMRAVAKKAKASGASKVVVKDLKQEFAKDYLWPMLKANAIYEGTYLLGTSIARPLIAKHQMLVAKKEKADAVAHGCTGKGNDQARFEMTYRAMDPEVTILAPWREWELKSREDEMDYAAEHGIPVPVSKKKPYSMDQNLWHLSFEGGVLEDPWNEPYPSMFKLTKNPEKAPAKGAVVTVNFKKGEPVGLNGKAMAPVALIQKLNKLAGTHGVGRVDIVENRLVGMKSRGVYECPAGTVLFHAHRALETLTLDRETMRFKETVSLKYAEMVYYGQWFSLLREAFDAWVNKTQEHATGDVRLKLYKGSVTVLGRKSPYALYDEGLATFGEGGTYDQKDSYGFIRLFGLPMTVKPKGKHFRGRP
jgi:argininosuccinate synthase